MVSREKYRGVLVRLSHSVLSLSHVHLSFNIYLSHPFVYVSLFLPFFFSFFSAHISLGSLRRMFLYSVVLQTMY